VRKEDRMVDLKDKLVLALGERDGVPGPALQKCIESAGGRVIYAATQCFV
jgi:glycine reductase